VVAPSAGSASVAVSVEAQVESVIRLFTQAVTPLGELVLVSLYVYLLAYCYAPPVHPQLPGFIGQGPWEVALAARKPITSLTLPGALSPRDDGGVGGAGGAVALPPDPRRPVSVRYPTSGGGTGGRGGYGSTTNLSAISGAGSGPVGMGGGAGLPSDAGALSPRSGISSVAGAGSVMSAARQPSPSALFLSTLSLAPATARAVSSAVQTGFDTRLLGNADSAAHRFSLHTASWLYDMATAGEGVGGGEV
jgi:hypothetical protein